MLRLISKFSLALSFCCLISFYSFSQSEEGSFIIDDHYRGLNQSDGIHFEIISDQNGLISAAHNQGVFQYDGATWDYYHTPTAAISLANDKENTLYVGCANGFGKLGWVDYNIDYIPIYNSDSTSELFFQTKYNDSKVYFLSEKSLFIYDISKQEIKKTFKDKFVNLFILDNKVYVNTEEKTFLILDNELQEITGIKDNLKIAKSLDMNGKDSVSLVLNEEGMLYNKTKGEKYLPLGVNSLIDTLGLIITDIQKVNDSLLVASTLDKGCAFINLKSNDVELLDQSRGLADNEVFAIHVDKEGGVWVSHEQGLSRVLVSFPAKSYSHLPGIHGNLTSVQRLNNKLWLTSNSGVYYFDRDTTFTNKVYYVVKNRKKKSRRRSRKRKVVAKSKPQPTATQPKKEEKKKKKRGIFSRLFNKKKSRLAEEQGGSSKTKSTSQKEQPKSKPGFFRKLFSKIAPSEKNATTKVKGGLQKDKIYIRKTMKIPVGVTSLYKKVQGSGGKCRELLAFNDEILGVSTSGLFEIEGNSARLVIDEPLNDAIHLKGTNQVLLLTYNQKIKLFELKDKVWIEQKSFDPSDIVKAMHQDDEGNVWLVGSSSIFQLKIEEEIIVENEYQIQNQRFDHVLMTNMGETMFFINTQGFFYLDKNANQIKLYEKWMTTIGKPVNYFKDSNGIVWVFNGKMWFEISKGGVITTHQYFNLFPKLKMITYDSTVDKYWLITGKNKLLAFDHTAEKIDSAAHSLFLKKIKVVDGILHSKGKLLINHDNTYLSFEMSKPDYLGTLKTEYRYKLVGMNDQWSDWTNNSRIDFSYLQPDSYTLYVQSRDSFGHIEDAEPVSFRVKTPYWETPWFYALEISLFAFLIFLSSKLKSTERNRFLKGALSVLTIVLIIEFLQSSMSSVLNIKSTPVVSFLVDVGTALMVFPVEKLLHKFLR